MNRPISELFKLSSETMKNMISVDEIIGNVIVANNNVNIIPVSKVKCTFATGGIESMHSKGENEYPFGGATGGVVNIVPVAFLVITNNDVKLLHMEEKTHLLEKIVDDIPDIIDKVKSLFEKNNISEKVEIIEKNIEI